MSNSKLVNLQFRNMILRHSRISNMKNVNSTA